MANLNEAMDAAIEKIAREIFGRIGLVDRVVAPEELDQAVREELDLVLSLPASSIAATKQLFNDVHGRPPRECRDYTANALADASK